MIRWIEAAPDGWNALVASAPAATPAHRPGLWSAFASVLPGFSLRALEVRDEGGLAGGMAVLVERRAGFHTLHALPLQLPGAPLARAGAHAAVDAACGAELAGLQRALRAIGGTWAFYRPGGPAPAPGALEAPPGSTVPGETTLVDLSGGAAAAWARIRPPARRQLRSAARLACAEEPEALDEAYALHRAQARTWPGHRPMPLELSRRLLEDGGDGLGPLARLFTARRDGRLLCAALVLDHPREAMPWWSGSRPEARDEHALPRLLWTVFEWAQGAGRTRVNLGASAGQPGIASFKAGLGGRPEPYPVRRLDPAWAPLAGRAAAALRARLRARRARGARP